MRYRKKPVVIEAVKLEDNKTGKTTVIRYLPFGSPSGFYFALDMA